LKKGIRGLEARGWRLEAGAEVRKKGKDGGGVSPAAGPNL